MGNLVASRMDNSGDHGTCRVFGTNLQGIVKDFFGLDSPVGRAILNRTIQSWFPWAIVLSRRSGRKKHVPEDAALILKDLYGNNPRYGSSPSSSSTSALVSNLLDADRQGD
jgi:hypothetical protein